MTLGYFNLCHREPKGRGDLLKALFAGDCFVAKAPRNDKKIYV